MIGKTLAHYEITDKLGQGGMGEVFRARDTKLERDVAIKVLPTAMSRDPERVLRFQREARALAALNHVNIGAIYGFEQVGDVRFLVLELIEGDTLADRLKAGPLPVDETLAIGKQIAEALEAAHASGIVHRDLKPANIKVDAEGHVKVLDFGLAKAFSENEPSSGATNLAASPTITADFTRPGVILGTAAYMSPEQARGRPIDKRTDIFSFGCVLYQCLTGQILFAGETVTDSIGAILHKQPDWDAIPPHTPPTVQLLLRRCLAKDRKQRLQDIGDARIELETAIADPTSSALKLAGVALAEAQHRPRRRAASLAAMFVVGAVLAVVVTQSLRPEPPPPPPVERLSIVLPQREDALGSSFGFDVSADGSRLVYRAADEEGGAQLYVRRLDEPTPEPLPGTVGGATAYVPVFSPDAKWIAYYDHGDHALKKISVQGGPSTTLCKASGIQGMTWTTDGYIVYCRRLTKGVFRVGENGGEPETVVSFDDEAAPFYARRLHALPDASAILFSGDATLRGLGKPSIKAFSFATGETTDLVDDATFPLYSESGHLLFLRESTLMAAPFDARRLVLTGPAVPFLEDVSRARAFGASVRITAAGTLFFRTGETRLRQRRIVSLDEKGVVTPLSERTGEYKRAALSPDGERVVLVVWNEQAEERRTTIWILDLKDDLLSILTSEPGMHGTPYWSPDGEWVYYQTILDDAETRDMQVWRRRADRSGQPERVYTQPRTFDLRAIHRNRQQLLIRELPSEELSPGTGFDIAVIDLEGEPKRTGWAETSFQEWGPAVSSNWKWVAFVSDETGKPQVYVRPLEGSGGSQQVSLDGGNLPFWSHDGSRLFYLVNRGKSGLRTLMEAKIRSAASQSTTRPTRPEVESREEVFDLSSDLLYLSARPDGKGFFATALVTTEQNDPAVIHIMRNAHERLKQIAPVPKD